MYWIFLIFLVFTGCNPFGFFKPTSDEIASANWAPDPDDPRRKKEPKKALYCYRTLGEPMFYDHDLGDAHRNRLVGKTPEPKEKEPTESSLFTWIPYPFR